MAAGTALQSVLPPNRSVAPSAYDVARGLGWFSIALGVAEVVAPGAIARSLGMPRSKWLLRLFGLREIGVGAGILASANPAPWIWARVAGDALDIGTAAVGLLGRNRRRSNVVFALLTLASVTALDVACGDRLTR